MNEPQLIVAHQGQYLPHKVRAGKIIRDGTSAIAPRDVLAFGLQEGIEIVVNGGQDAMAMLVSEAQARASRLDADYFSVGQVIHRPATSGWEIVSTVTQAYVRNPNTLPPAASSRGHDTMGSEGEPDG